MYLAAVVSGDSVKSWSTSNKKVVKVSKKGVVRAVGNGKAVITVKTKKGASVKLKVTVRKKAVETTGLKVTNVKKNKLSLKKGKTQITVTSGSKKVKITVTVK